MSYIDTSVIIAALDPIDPRRNKAIEVLENEHDKIISELTLVELASTLARREKLLGQMMDKLGLNREETILAILIYILKKFGIRYETIDGWIRYPLVGKVYKPIATAVELSKYIKLRTLDLLHLAYTKLLMEKGIYLQKLITMDSDYEKISNIIKKLFNIAVRVIV